MAGVPASCLKDSFLELCVLELKLKVAPLSSCRHAHRTSHPLGKGCRVLLSTVSLALNSLLLCCQLWFYTTVMASSNRPGPGEGADFNPKLTSPQPRETEAMKHTHSPAHCKSVACTVWLAWAERTPVSQCHEVSGKQVQVRAEPPAGCSALWLFPEALVQLCCTSWRAGHLRGKVLLAVNVGQVHGIQNMQGRAAARPHSLPFLQCLPQDVAGCCLKTSELISSDRSNVTTQQIPGDN